MARKRKKFRRNSHPALGTQIVPLSTGNPNTDRVRGLIEATPEQREHVRKLIVEHEKNHHEAAALAGLEVETVRQLAMTFRTQRQNPATGVLNVSAATHRLFHAERRPDEENVEETLLRVLAQSRAFENMGLSLDA